MNIDKKTSITIASTLMFGLLLGWIIFGGENQTANGGQPDMKMAGETIWTCSMHPQIRRNEPGDCPICGMDLIPLEGDQSSGADPMGIRMSETAMKLANVSTAVVGTAEPVKSVQLNGKVQADERLVFSQSSHIPGRIEELMVNFTGEYVSKGQEIISIYSPELVTAQRELFEAQKIKDTQPQLFEAAKEKLKNWKLSEKQIEQILQSRVSKETFTVLADVSGYVLAKKVALGDHVGTGEVMYELADLSKVWVLFDVYETDLSWVKKGDLVKFTVASLPGETFAGKISFLDPVINPKTRVAKARVEVLNRDLKLKPEMFASGTVEAQLPKKQSNIVVPKSAVMWTGKRSLVYVKSESTEGVHFIMREVTLGPALGDSFIVEDGLQSGEEIAVNGTFSIDAAAQLAGKPSMMSPSGGPAMRGHSHGGMEMSTTSGESTKEKIQPIGISQKSKDALTPLYAEYFGLKDALVADDSAVAQKASVNLQAALNKIDMAAFTGDAHNAWMKYSRDLKRNLLQSPQDNSMPELREAFRKVSETMIAITNTFGPLDKTLYVQYCPMANNNKGANWLSQAEDIRNPYFGNAMLKCGEVVSVIK